MNSEDDNGMTARILDSVFSHEKQIEVSISFIEIYNDQAFDLLSENAQDPFYKKGKMNSYDDLNSSTCSVKSVDF